MSALLNQRTWVAIAFAAVLAFAGWQSVRLSDVRADLATEQRDRTQENSDRLRAALRESERVAALQLTHAAHQQEIVDVYEFRIQAEQAGRIADADRAERVRRQFAASAARDREAARSDPTACERVADRSEVIGATAAEGGQLLAEARRALAGRDAEVTLLLGLMHNDRRLMEQQLKR